MKFSKMLRTAALTLDSTHRRGFVIRKWLPLRGAMLLFAALPLRLHAQDTSAVDAAEQAMTAKLPEVAIEKLNGFLASTSATDGTLVERAETDLTRAMLDSGDAAGALARLDFPNSGAERFWKAEALSALDRWEEAGPLYAEVAADGPANLHDAATIGHAEALREQGRTPEAITTLSAIHTTLSQLRLAELYLDTDQLEAARQLLAKAQPASLLEDRWRKYIEGRVYLAEDQAAPAQDDFEELLGDPRGLTASLHAGAAVGLAEARIALNGREVADNVIEDYISQYPDSPYLGDMFLRLDEIYAGEDSPSDSELRHWAADAPPRRAALALYYEAKSLHRQDRDEKAIRAYTEFLQRYPHHSFDFEASMQLGELYLETGHIPTAISAFEGAMRYSSTPRERARSEIATGNANFAQGDFLIAVEHFSNAANRSSELWFQATYDSALAWLHLGNYNRFLEDYTAISQRYPETEERHTLLLEEGLLQARSGDPRAAGTLLEFIRDFPDNRRAGEARVALAELEFAGGNLDSASQLLKAAYQTPLASQTPEQADFLAIFIADSGANRDEDNVIKLGLDFLKKYPDSPLRPQVRMKLGQVYFQREDFANAETQFETLAQENPSDPLADKALILAGQSSVKSMSPDGTKHAMDLFDRVVQGSGPLRLYARQEQALVEAGRGHEKDAAIIYDDILRSNPDAPLRLAALCGKADCLVAAEDAAASPAPSPSVSGSTGADEACSAAIALYDQVIHDPDVTGPWRDQALYKKGRCLDKEGLADQALAAYYDVLNAPKGGKQQPPDFYWFDKAGFDAAAMLEGKAQWPGAISVLDKVARAGGPRSAEARKRADELRLEHFVWD
ncbi:MAG TPA: tetratricopeptide repeat protein [Chthoniobacteraceae bacterium]|jgi:tetratricopeptide (TPR) repeat protein|nr:tetratricopeptide repeat protein [Chthoniobacteraceae bacterium]